MIEPTHGSIVLLHSDSGTAAQRFYSDGLWRIVGKTGKFTFNDLIKINTNYDNPIPITVYLPPPD